MTQAEELLLEDDAQGASRVGRKRDERVHERILQAAMDVFVQKGWSGFTLDAVARDARVGKSSMYLRYSSREELILEMVDHFQYPIDDITGASHASIDDELRVFAESYAAWLDLPEGLMAIRQLIETRLNPDLNELLTSHSNEIIGKTHGIIRRAKRRGEIPASASAAVMLDSLLGALVHHTVTASERPTFSSPAGQAFVRHVVEQTLAGARAAIATQ